MADHPQPAPRLPGPDAASVREQLHKVLASRIFANAARMSRFLEFVVERTLAGGAEELKEYVIGVEVFDRPASFDPRVDPIVRVEARRLRAKLKTYYESVGPNDGLILSLPTGSYAPGFEWREAAPAEAPAAAGNSLAVLPFVNLSPEADSDYFSDGLTEELSHGLTKIEGLCVVAWRSAAQWKDRLQDLRAIGEQLHVTSLVTGSVRRAADRLRVIAQLVDAATGQVLWSETFERQVADIFAIQQEISFSIVRSLRLRLQAPAVHASRNIETYDLYLRGRFHWNKRTPEGLDRAIELFTQAIEMDPEFAPAHAGLADAYILRADHGMGPMLPGEVMPKAKAAALRAIQLDPTLAEPHNSLGSISGMHEWRWPEAERYYRRAVELNPNYVHVRHWYACDFLTLQGRVDEAFTQMEIAVRLDPLAIPINESLAHVLLLSRRYDEALRKQHEICELDPFYYKCYSGRARIFIQTGRYGEAIEMLLKARSLAGDVSIVLGALGQAYGLAGRRSEALAVLEKLEQMGRDSYVPWTSMALVHCGLGDKARALAALETACDRRDLSVTAIGIHPAYDVLRGEPEFTALLRRIGLPA